MALFSKNRRIIAWLACLAILLNALAPAISHAMAAANGKSAPWAQICTTSGTKFIALDLALKSDQKQDENAAMNMDHCAYCVTHAGSFGMTASNEFVVYAPNLSYDLPQLFYHAPRPLFVWAAANPRAPPVVS